MYRITELARAFGLSRTALLYYDRLGLLSPSLRSRANYRVYSEQDRNRLERICAYRKAGLNLKDVAALLALEARGGSREDLLLQRLHSLGKEIQALQDQQRLVAGMLQVKARGWQVAAVDKDTWVQMLGAAGMDDAAMDAWHREFESRAPEAHDQFLRSLGIGDPERLRIRAEARS